jgi:hypothetical protein
VNMVPPSSGIENAAHGRTSHHCLQIHMICGQNLNKNEQKGYVRTCAELCASVLLIYTKMALSYCDFLNIGVGRKQYLR